MLSHCCVQKTNKKDSQDNFLNDASIFICFVTYNQAFQQGNLFVSCKLILIFINFFRQILFFYIILTVLTDIMLFVITKFIASCEELKPGHKYDLFFIFILNIYKI